MKTHTRTIKIQHKHLEDAVTSYLYAISVLNDDEDVVAIDFGIPVDKSGMVELDVEIAGNDQMSLKF